MEKLFSIRNIESLTGIKAATIRMWEKRYNLIEPKRTQTNIRFYDFKDVKKLLLIAELIREGFKISELASLTVEQLYERAILVYSDENILSGDLSELYFQVLNYNALAFESIVNQLIVRYGFAYVFSYLLLPLLYKIDADTDDGAIEKTHRNFVFFLVEKFLMSSINRLNTNASERKYVLFSDAYKINNIILLFGAYRLLSLGKQTLILGPIDDLDNFFDVIDSFKDYNVLTTSFFFKKDNDYFFERIQEFSEFNFFVLDPNIQMEDAGYPNLFLLQNLMEIDKEII